MGSLKTLREKLLISQRDLCAYLSVSQSLLALAELSERKLPTAALIKLSGLALALEQQKAKPTHPSTAAQAGKLRAYADDCMEKARVLERRIKRMEQAYQQALVALAVFEQVMAQTEPNARKDRLWLELMRDAAQKIINKSDTSVLSVKLEGLRHEAELASAKAQQLLNQPN